MKTFKIWNNPYLWVVLSIYPIYRICYIVSISNVDLFERMCSIVIIISMAMFWHSVKIKEYFTD